MSSLKIPSFHLVSTNPDLDQAIENIRKNHDMSAFYSITEIEKLSAEFEQLWSRPSDSEKLFEPMRRSQPASNLVALADNNN